MTSRRLPLIISHELVVDRLAPGFDIGQCLELPDAMTIIGEVVDACACGERAREIVLPVFDIGAKQL